jgi:hypothetical protein
MTSKKNIVLQVTKSHNKNKKKRLVVNGKRIAKKFNEKYYIYNNTRHLANDCRNRA